MGYVAWARLRWVSINVRVHFDELLSYHSTLGLHSIPHIQAQFQTQNVYFSNGFLDLINF